MWIGFNQLIVAAAILSVASPSFAAADQRQALQNLRSADLRMARIAYRLIAANARLCDRKMPEIGAIIHALDQYPPPIRADAARELGFESLIAVEAVVPGSAADLAGIKPGDGLLAINDLELPRALPAGPATSASRDAVERAIAELPPDRPIAVRYSRQGQIASALVQPAAACRTRFEILPADRLIARSDGETIQISSAFLARFDDEALAVAFAHELAHTVLRHRAMLEAARSRSGPPSPNDTTRQLKRLAEREADRLSVHLLANAGFDPEIAPRFWREHGARLSPLAIGYTAHDSAKTRSAALDAEIALMRER